MPLPVLKFNLHLAGACNLISTQFDTITLTNQLLKCVNCINITWPLYFYENYASLK